MAALPTGEPSWKWRRLFLAGTLTASFLLLADIQDAADTRANESIAFGLVTLIWVSLGYYFGLATWQDVTAIKTMRSALPYRPPPAEEERPG